MNITMNKIINKLKSLLSWSNRIGSDEIHEITSIIEDCKEIQKQPSFTIEEIVKTWKDCYGEDLILEYPGFYDNLLKLKIKI